MIRQQIMLVTVSFAIGMLVVLLYELLIIIREILGMGRIMQGLTDFLFWETSAVILFIITYRINEGIIRGYAVAALFLGMILFWWSVGARFLAWSRKLLKKIRRWVTINSEKVSARFKR